MKLGHLVVVALEVVDIEEIVVEEAIEEVRLDDQEDIVELQILVRPLVGMTEKLAKEDLMEDPQVVKVVQDIEEVLLQVDPILFLVVTTMR